MMIRHWPPALFALAVFDSFAAETAASSWTPLLDERLTQWETFLGRPHASVTVPG